ncbi:MAG: MobF family relaxase [Dehalococcoidia bacterium]
MQNSTPAGAKSYYTTADYYMEGQELHGIWRGQGAARLGLTGAIEREDWDALADNLDPDTGEKLTVRQKEGRRVGYDFTFNAPKSLSLLYSLTEDERLLGAFRDAVNATMADMEAEMEVRVRKAGSMQDRTTGNMVWGEYTHLTSRPVDGVPDPQLHTHAFVFNVSYDDHEQRWKAGQFGNLMRSRKYFEAVFHSDLARRIEQLGIDTKRTAGGWDIAGLDKQTLGKFSRRTAEIEALARKLGITDPLQKDALGARTRSAKVKELTMPELQKEWRSWLTESESGQIDGLARRVGGRPLAEDKTEAAAAAERAIEHAFARQSVVPERELLAAALRQGYGKVSRETMEKEMARADVIRVKRGDRMLVTTRSVLDEETRMLDFAREGRGTCQPIAPVRTHTNRQWLNAEQKRAVAHVLGSRDRVMSVRGAAGVGKTSSLEEIRDAVEETGGKVFAVAPSAGASRGGLREAGFESAETLARLLKDEQLQDKVRGSLVIVDEAGMVGSEDMRSLFDLAAKKQLRLLLVGDLRQHGSVARGSALRLLEEQAGIAPVEITEIQRQKKKEYKEAVAKLSEGSIADGFRRLDRLGWIHEVADTDRYRALAKAYVDSVQAGKTSLVVSPTHAEGRRTTDSIRAELRQRGLLGEQEHTFAVLRPAQFTLGEKLDATKYVEGDVLSFHQNAKGYKKGQRVTVEPGQKLPIDQARRFEVFHPDRIGISVGDRLRITQGGKTADGLHALNNGDLFTVKDFTRHGDIVLGNGWVVGKDYGHVALGHTVTSHASQGKTVDHVFIAQSSQSFAASGREQFYVSASRAREQVQLFTDSKAELLEAVSHGDERLSATELVGYDPHKLIRERLIEQAFATPDPVLAGGRSRDWEVDLER